MPTCCSIGGGPWKDPSKVRQVGRRKGGGGGRKKWGGREGGYGMDMDICTLVLLKARGNPSYGVPEHLLREVAIANSLLDEERLVSEGCEVWGVGR